MAEENIEDLDSTTQELDGQEELETEELEETDDLDVLKEKLNKTLEANKKLFARTKKAEGFEEVDGKWVKKTTEVKPELKKKEEPAVGDIDRLLDEKLEKRELESLDVSDQLKKEVAIYAKLNSVSIKKALASDYIQFKKEQEDSVKESEEASLGGSKRGTTKKDYSKVDPKSFDPSTEQGKKDKAEWEKYIREELG